MSPCCVSGCALFILLLLFYPPSRSPSAARRAHPLAAASGSRGLRSANSAGPGNTLTLCPILSSPSKGQSKPDLQLRLKQNGRRGREGEKEGGPASAGCSPSCILCLQAREARGQGEMKLSLSLRVAVSAGSSVRGNERLVTFVCTGHLELHATSADKQE